MNTNPCSHEYVLRSISAALYEDLKRMVEKNAHTRIVRSGKDMVARTTLKLVVKQWHPAPPDDCASAFSDVIRGQAVRDMAEHILKEMGW